MSIQRLRQVLSSNFTAVIDSSQATANKVQSLANARQQNLTAAGKTPPRTKPGQIVAALANTPLMTFRAIDLLRKAGELTNDSILKRSRSGSGPNTAKRTGPERKPSRSAAPAENRASSVA